MSRIVLKPGREKAILKRHPWIFSGAVEDLSFVQDGEILPVYSSSGNLLASAYFHSKNSIAGRILSWGKEDPLKTVAYKIKAACKLRASLVDTNACRMINAEGDGLPGLIVDKYQDVLVIQINTCGMDKLREIVIKELVANLSLRSIFEKSISAARRQEGLVDRQGVLFGPLVTEVIIQENGISYLVSIATGQKTGFFLDQREMRYKVGTLAKGRKVLNCFAYSGGFSVAALKGGALFVDSVEISQEACRLCAENTKEAPNHRLFQEDVFEFLQREELNYDLVILDPPAFAKKRGDIEAACRGYKELNLLALKKMPEGSILITSSCSSYIGEELFQNILFQAALQAGRVVRILGRHSQAPDHPVSLNHPEGDYLKSLILYVDQYLNHERCIQVSVES